MGALCQEKASNYNHHLFWSYLSPERKIETLTKLEFESFRKAVEKMEGWEAGWEEFYEKQFISAVKRKGSTIIEYQVQGKEGKKWLTKAEAVILRVRRTACHCCSHKKGDLPST